MAISRCLISVNQCDKSERILEMIPASESSEKPIIISSDSYFLRAILAEGEEAMLLRANAANCTSLS